MLRLAVLALALLIVTSLGARPAAAASVPTLPLATPPVESNLTANAIFDAMIAIGRAAGNNPQAAQRASFSYQAAIQQYQSGDLDRARQSAIQAIAESSPPTLPTNPMLAPVTLPALPLLPDEQQAEMESRLGVARRALTNCGPTTGAPFATARTAYDVAVRDLLARNANDLTHTVQSIVDKCAGVMAGLSGPTIPAK